MKKLPFIMNDGGREATRPDERLDCTVRALAVYLGINYLDAHKMMERYRKDKHKSNSTRLAYAEQGLVFLPIKTTLGRFMSIFGGNYIIAVKGHVMAIKDGIIQDMQGHGSNKVVKGIFVKDNV